MIDDPLLREIRDSVTERSWLWCGLQVHEGDEPIAVSVEELMEAFRFFYAPADVLPWDQEDGVYIGRRNRRRPKVVDLDGRKRHRRFAIFSGTIEEVVKSRFVLLRRRRPGHRTNTQPWAPLYQEGHADHWGGE